MQYPFWLVRETIIVVFVSFIHLRCVDGRRYDKCETPDGREGVCVVKRYCREATVQPLKACDNDNNFCCPIPTTLRSAQPPVFPVSEPHDTRNNDSPKSVPNVSQDKDRKWVRDDQRPSYSNQRPPYSNANPGEDSLSNVPTDSHKVLYNSNGDNPRTITSNNSPGKLHSTRNNGAPDVSQDNGRRTVARDFPNNNQRPSYGNANPEEDSLSHVPTDSHKVFYSSDDNNRRTVISHNNPEERHNSKNNDLPKSIQNTSQDNERPLTRDNFPNINQRPSYGNANSGDDSLSNVETDSHKVLYNSNDNNRRTVTSYNNPEERHNTRNNDLPKSIPNTSQDNDHRFIGDNERSRYGRPNPGVDSPSNLPADSHNVLSTSGGNSRRPETSRPNPEKDIKPEIRENRKRTVTSGHPNNPSYIPTPGGRVRFEDAEDLFNDQNNKNQRVKAQTSNSNTRPTAEHSGKDSNNKQNSTGSDSVRNNRNVYPKPSPSTVGHYPSKHQLDIQKLPSNPRRLNKPLHNDDKNDTFDENVRHTFFPHSLPKVPACGVKPYDLFIAGGETSEAYEWPWMTSIFRRHQGSRPKTFLCGGSLINTKYVLTAAHCFVNNYVVLPASSFVIRLGSNFLDSGEEYTVSDLVIHYNHSGLDFFNDIALVKIASEVYITDKIAPICLPTPDMMSYDFVDRMATVAGWGDTTFRTGSSRALQHVTIPIVSGEECFAAYSRVRGAAFLARGSEHVICAGLREGGKDACLGDSGGPLMLKTVDDRWIIVGIVSLGYKCAEPGYPGVYTRVTHYLTWIQANMKPH